MRYIISILCFLSVSVMFLTATSHAQGRSIYSNEPQDTSAVYFTTDNYDIKTDGTTDVSDEIQKAINKVAIEKNFGIVFIPEGKYKISKTIYVPRAVRLIGYGKNRPEFFLPDNTPGYQQSRPGSRAGANFMFWFTGSVVRDTNHISDANAGTFYSGMANIDLRIGKGNPYAIALRTHYAQHCFIEHADIHIGEGMAGMFDVGNEMEDVRFFGGDYGIYTTKTSEGWQFLILDTYFEGQRKAAIRTLGVGLTMVNVQIKNAPEAVQIEPGFHERLFMEDCRLENIGKAAIAASHGNNAGTQINLINTDCSKVPVLIDFRQAQPDMKVKWESYKIKSLSSGLQMDDLASEPTMDITQNIEPVKRLPAAAGASLPSFPPMDQWKNIKDLGAKGDGKTDDTKIFQEAIDKYDVIYLPQGWYVISETLTHIAAMWDEIPDFVDFENFLIL